MSITLAGLAKDAWARWRRDRGTLLALAGPFLFLPLLAWLLLIEEPVPAPGATDTQRMQQIMDWASANLHWMAARIAIELFGALVILTLYLARGHRDVAGVLTSALILFPRFVVAVMASWGLIALIMLPASIAATVPNPVVAAVGLAAFIIPALYSYGRVALTGAVLTAEPEVGIFGAIGRSIRLTRGRGWQVFGYVAMLWLIGMVAAQLLGAPEQQMQVAGAINPVVVAIMDVLAAAAVSATTLARLLLEVALYRRLAAPRHGV